MRNSLLRRCFFYFVDHRQKQQRFLLSSLSQPLFLSLKFPINVLRTEISFHFLDCCYCCHSKTTDTHLLHHQLHTTGIMDQASEQIGKKDNDSNASKDSKSYVDDIVPHILNLYACSTTPSDFDIYAPDATFEDPLMTAHGVKEIKSAFYSLRKVFKESRIVEYSVKENIISPGKHEILIDNKQHYKFWGRDIEMISLIKLDVEDGKVVRHEDRWDKQPLKNRETVETPLVGRMIEAARRGSMFATHAMMGFGKDPTETQQ